MQARATLVQRYRRTDRSRDGEWQAVDSGWKSVASAGLVGHDIYHHLPGDQGRFAEEVATFGAEWYVDMQPIGASFYLADKRDLARLEGNVVDTVLNALDSREARAFCLPTRAIDRLTEAEMSYFEGLAAKALEVLDKSADPRARTQGDFTARFVQSVLWGYAQAKARFPDQRAARNGCRELRNTLADMERHEVPIGHEITIALAGSACSVTYADADVPFLLENSVEAGYAMAWCSAEHGYPLKEFTLHHSEREYVDYVEEHFFKQDGLLLPEEHQRMPKYERCGLMKVYVRNPAMQQALREGLSWKLPYAIVYNAEVTPRGVPVL
jgi:hypothetical protein